MVRVQVRGNEIEDAGYPQIKVSANGLTVLFTADTVGTVLEGNSVSTYTVGYYARNWDPSQFKPWRGTVTLTQD